MAEDRRGIRALWRRLVDLLTYPGGGYAGADRAPDTVAPGQQLQARTLASIQALLSALLTVLILVLLLRGDTTSAWILILSILPCLWSIWLGRRGRVQMAGFHLALSMILVVTWLLVVGSGIHDIATIAYPLILIIASVLLEWRTFLVVAGLTLASAAAVILLEISGLVVTPFSERTTLSDLVLVLAVLGAAAWVARLLAESWTNALAEVRQVSQRQATLIEDARRRADHLALLNRAALAVNSGPDLERVVSALYQCLRDVVSVDSFYVAIYEASSGRILFPFFSSSEDLVDAGSASMDDQPGLTGEVIRRRSTLYLPDLSDPQTLAGHQVIFVHDDPTHSYLGIPLVAQEQVIGVLSVQSNQADAYTAEQISLLETVATQVSSAIENARLYTALQEELVERQRSARVLRQREAILEATTFAAETFLSQPDWRLGIDNVLERLGQAVDCGRVYIYANRLPASGYPKGIRTRLLYEWAAPNVSPLADNPAYTLFELPQKGGERWLEAMLRDEPVSGPPVELTLDEQEYLDFWDTASYLDMPIYLSRGVEDPPAAESSSAAAERQEYWWGFLGFTDLEVKRCWSTAEIDTLRLAASLLAAAIQRQRADQQLRQLNDELEQRVHQRTLDLEASNQELQTFAYSVAHDLKGPLRGIDGYSRLLIEDHGRNLDSEALFYLGNVRRAAQHMGQVIEDLLSLFRVTRAAMRLEQADLSEMAERFLTELMQAEPQRPVEVIVQPGLLVQGDASLLRMALKNLLFNAWKFTDRAARAVIEVGMEQKFERTVYYVRDNGVGFDMKFADKLFGVFERLHPPDEYEGSGVGLAIVQRIIQRHGGDIWAESEVGQGATFYFTLG